MKEKPVPIWENLLNFECPLCKKKLSPFYDCTCGFAINREKFDKAVEEMTRRRKRLKFTYN